ncbi:MAG: sugar ABC transporter permease [Spirochaetales bacterium]|nr:sugar ABC transporter permease [Spirochaetales bacterium]
MAKNNAPSIQHTSLAVGKPRSVLSRFLYYKYFYLMLVPGILFYALFMYWPYIEIRQALWDWGVLGPKDFIGLKNFAEIMKDEIFWNAFRNTFLLSGVRIVLEMFAAIILALLLNEVRKSYIKRTVQTVLYLPHFLSWVVTASIFTLILSPGSGFVNAIIKTMGGTPIYFLTEEFWWPIVYYFLRLWHDTGWATIVFLAALAGVDPELYEASWIDGAGRIKQMWYITLPHITTTIVIVLMINLSHIFRLFEPVFVLQNPLVSNVSEVIMTYVYRRGLVQGDFDYGIAVGLFNSVISLVLVVGANLLVKKIRKEGIF